ncbi:MAG: hypothetical protein PHW62_00705 [Candidatus Ratteibacteria bacterium]|nr:hypothetical protein [Candidatus Ratteibacteria bacterium]
MKLDVLSKSTNQFIGTIQRKATHERQFGNSGAFEISVGGKRYWGTGKDVYLPDIAIRYLKSHGQIMRE